MVCEVARLIVDGPRAPAANMAFDEALLDCCKSLTVRATRWTAPAATLGRFQPYQQFQIDGEDRLSIRRITGGGAILHGADCTLALVADAPSTAFPDPATQSLAARAAETLRTALSATVSGDSPSLRVRGGDHQERDQVSIADCFARQSPYDLVIGVAGESTKAAGFALHRRQRRVLVQASVIRSPLSLEPEQDRELLENWARALGAETWESSEFTGEEVERARHYETTRYSQPAWNERTVRRG